MKQPQELEIDEFEYNLLYAFYSIPNIFMVFLGGLYLDTVGRRLAALTFSFLVVTGAALVAFAAGTRTYLLMLVGRFIFGIGAESLVVAQNSFIVAWFAESNLALAIAISTSISRLGTFFSYNVEGYIAEVADFVTAFWFAAGLCVLCFIFNVILNMIDSRHGKVEEKVEVHRDPEASWNPFAKKTHWPEIFHLEEVKQFPRSFWIVSLLIATFYSAVFPFTAISTAKFQRIWGFSKVQAGQLTSIVIASSFLLAPFFGGLVDRIGRRTQLLMLGTFLLVPGHAVLGIFQNDISPIPSMVVMGLGFALVPAALWPSIPLLVPEKDVGAAYGASTAVQNTALALTNIVVGLLDKNLDFGYVSGFFVFYAVVSVGLSSYLYRLDIREGGTLQRSEAEQRAIDDKVLPLLGEKTSEKA